MNKLIPNILNILKIIILFFVTSMEFLLVCRAIFALFLDNKTNRIYSYIYNITELFLSPIRNIIYKFSFLNIIPIDISIIICFLILNRLRMTLS